jgi:hypothetical protein
MCMIDTLLQMNVCSGREKSIEEAALEYLARAAYSLTLWMRHISCIIDASAAMLPLPVITLCVYTCTLSRSHLHILALEREGGKRLINLNRARFIGREFLTPQVKISLSAVWEDFNFCQMNFKGVC